MNMVGALLCFWIGAGLLYVAIDPRTVPDAMTGQAGVSGQAGVGHGTTWRLYKAILAPFGATSG